MQIRSFVWGFAAALALGGALAWGQGPRTTDDTVIAIVNDESITFRQLVNRVLDYHGEITLDAMVNRALVKQAAEKEKVTLTDRELEDQLTRVKNLLSAGDPAKREQNYRQWLQTSGITAQQHRDQLRYTLLEEKIVEKQMPITDADLERLSVRVIACNDEQKAKDLIRRLRQGADFATLAKTESADQRARLNEGLMPPFHRLQMPTMWQFANRLEPGEFTREPVPARDGFVVLKLEARVPARTLKPQERQELTSMVKVRRMEQWLTDARKKAKITMPVPLKNLIQSAMG